MILKKETKRIILGTTIGFIFGCCFTLNKGLKSQYIRNGICSELDAVIEKILWGGDNID